MKFLIGFIFLVSPCWSGHYTHHKINQNIEIGKNVINQEAVFKQTQAVNSTTVSTSQISATKQGPCYCVGGLCACCSKLLFSAWKQSTCVNVTYDPDEFSFTTKVLMNDRILYTRTISGNIFIHRQKILFNLLLLYLLDLFISKSDRTHIRERSQIGQTGLFQTLSVNKRNYLGFYVINWIPLRRL